MSSTSPSDHPQLPPDADRAKIDALADLLIAAREHGRPIDAVPEKLHPVDPDEALLVDDRVAARTGWPVLGWKIGCTSEHTQQLLGSPGPFPGRVYSVSESGHVAGFDEFCSEPHLEGEFAFVLGRDLLPTDTAVDRDAVIDAIAEVRPAIEVVGGRYAGFVGTPLPLLVADAGINSHLVLGPAAPSVDLDRLSDFGATMEVDGQVVGRGSGADVLGDPIESLRWLVDHAAGRGIALRQGQVVTTGTATQVVPLPPGSTATASLDGIGSVSLVRARN